MKSFFVIGYALDGQAEYKIMDRRYSLQKGGLILLPPGTPRVAAQRAGQPVAFYLYRVQTGLS